MALLDEIVEEFKKLNYRISEHVWENYVHKDDRPTPSAILYSIVADAPKLVTDDPTTHEERTRG